MSLINRITTKLAVAGAAVAAFAAVSGAPHEASAASRCIAALDTIAWNYDGDTNWNRANARRLCRGAGRSTAPARCFRRVMFSGINWGGGTRWRWQNAVDLCEGAVNPERRIRCFRRSVRRGLGWSAAIARCDERRFAGGGGPVVTPRYGRCAREASRIAYNYTGARNWNPVNLRRLCGGLRARSAEPARCFRRVMHGGINWGGGAQWDWRNAIDLCERTDNARRTVRCFQRRVARGLHWRVAIRRCGR